MKTLLKLGLAVFFSVSVLGINAANVSAEPEQDTEKKVELTEDQKNELDTLYQEMMKTKKQIIMKYEEFGVISSEKADKKMEWMEKHYKMMKENDFIPKKRHHHKKYGKDEKTDQ